MLDLDINGRKYKAPHSWDDISCKEFMLFDQWVKDNIPEKFNQFLFEEEKPDLTVEDKYEIIDFKRKYVCQLTGISEKDSRDIKLNDEKNFGILDLWEAMKLFMYFPDIEPQSVKGYWLDKESLDTKPMEDTTFGQFETSSTIKNNLDKMKKGDVSGMAVLAAVLYRTVVKSGWWIFKKETVLPYDEAKAKERAKEFEMMSMTVIWGAYFFLLKQRGKYLHSLVASLKEKETQNSGVTDFIQ